MKKQLFTIEKGFEKATSIFRLIGQTILTIALFFIWVLVVIAAVKSGWGFWPIFLIHICVAFCFWIWRAIKKAPDLTAVEDWMEQQKRLRQLQGHCINYGQEILDVEQCPYCGAYNN